MWSADVAALSVDGWQPNEDAVGMLWSIPFFNRLRWQP